MAELVDVGVEELLDVNDGVRVVLRHSDAGTAFCPSDEGALGVLRHQNGFHALSISDPMKGDSIMMEGKEDRCVTQHLFQPSHCEPWGTSPFGSHRFRTSGSLPL